MQDSNDDPVAPAVASVRFDADRLRTTSCDVVAATVVTQGIELHFGVQEPREAAAGIVGTRAAHSVRLDCAAAVHLEEVLTRVLGASPRSDARPGRSA